MQYMKKLILLILVSVCLTSLSAQETYSITDELNWQSITEEQISFEGAFTTNDAERLPVYMYRFPVPGNGTVSARIISADFEEAETDITSNQILDYIKIESRVEWDRKNAFGRISFIPLRDGNNGLEKLTSFEISIDFSPIAPTNSPNTRDNTYTSALSDGDIYKFSVSEYGIHKLDFAFLESLGMSPGSINPQNIQILGNGGGELPAKNSDFRYDDLQENAIFISGENDGSFDNGDYILFYAEGADKRTFDEDDAVFDIEKNKYDDNNYYFIKIGSENGLRISNGNNPGSATYNSSSFNAYQKLEQETYNVLHEYLHASGSGSQWYGDKFDLVNERTYNFNFPNIDNGSPLQFDIGMIGRKNGSQYINADDSYFFASINGEQFQSSGMNATNMSNVEARHANEGYATGSITPNGENISVTIRYDYPGAEGWLDYILLNCRRALRFNNEQLTFRDINSVGQSITQFQIGQSNGNMEVWDVTNPLNPIRQSTDLSGSNLTFNATTNTLKEFIAFDNTTGFKTPTAIGQIENQNLHGIDNADALLIYHRDFEAAANELAAHREEHSGISVALAEISQVYNEFASGSKDPLAIRDMARMLFERSDNFKYLILFGDGSFDYKDYYEEIEFNPNFIPVYETAESLAPIQAFPSDDYFALLSPDEGDDLRGALDIAVGRIPVASSLEANNAVQKIIQYDKDPESLGDWRTRITYVADDEDSNTHINQADRIATIIDTTYHDFNINKIYFDAFQQVSSSGGNSYPDAKASINSSIFKGQLIVNYLGHGGPTSWAQERVLQESDINSWQNKTKLPLFVTATCSFTSYDDPLRVSAGEKVFIKENGGAIGLFTTTRAVYSSSNERLTRETFENLFERVDGEYPPLGEILRIAKNSNSADTTDTNARKFTLIGDPTLHLAIPKHDVVTTAINGQPLSALDTISALEQVSISGFVADGNGNKLDNFNGVIYPTVYDKSQEISTLANDPGSSVRQFGLQKNIIFKGAASVSNGEFTFSFIVPKDINYEYGLGRISYYASDGATDDAAGSYERLVIGGTSTDPIEDDNPPLVEVFMNDEEFVFGGLTNTNPILYVKLSDDFGINVAGTGIGHDLTAVLDDNNQDIIVLNDFYEAEVNDFKKGEARYPLNDIKPGRHTIRVKGWDIANNSGEGYTEFVVAEDANIALDHVLNYPNPFTTNTEFQFEHNLAGQMLRVEIQIFTVAGNLVKTIFEDVFADGNRITGIQWDGTDDYGDKIGRGVYLYKVTVGNFNEENINQSTSSEFQKLVILK